MEFKTIQMTAQIPSSFGMPACGHAFATTAGAGTTSVVRERQGAVISGDAKGVVGFAAYLPGTSAWRPPSS